MEAKGNIRKEVFARRRAATQEEIQEKSRMIYEKITALPEFLDADCFFAYMDFKKEVMTRDLIEKALQMGKTVAVPRVEGDDMVYYEIKDFSTLKSGYFGIMEPDGGKVCTRDMEKDFMTAFLPHIQGLQRLQRRLSFSCLMRCRLKRRMFCRRCW